MKGLIYLYLVEVFVMFYLVTLGLFHENNPVYSGMFIFSASLEFIYFFYKKNRKKNEFAMVGIFFLALIIRIVIMNYDIYINVINMSDSGDYRAAAEIFFKTNQLIFRGTETNGLTIRLMGAIYKVFGYQKVNISYVSIMCFMGASYLTNEILKKLEVKDKIRYICMIWMLFTPQTLIITSLSNREGYIIFAVSLAIYYLFLWWQEKKYSYLVKGMIAMIFGTCIHSGVIVILVAYVFLAIFYDRKKERFYIKWNTCLNLSMVFLVFVIMYINFGDTIFYKFGSIDEVSDISNVAWTSVRGGSGYVLPGNGASSLGEILLYTPIRAIYFMFSPMPKYWRGIVDIMSFLICSGPHIIAVILFLKKIIWNKTIDKRKYFLIPIFVTIVAGAIIFGWGVSNAGTAIRHRDKFLCLSVIILALELDISSQRCNEKEDVLSVCQGGELIEKSSIN